MASRHSAEAAVEPPMVAPAADGTTAVFACRDCNFKSVNSETYLAHIEDHQEQRTSEEDKVMKRH